MVCNRTALPLFSEFFSKLLKAIFDDSWEHLTLARSSSFSVPTSSPGSSSRKGLVASKGLSGFLCWRNRDFFPPLFYSVKSNRMYLIATGSIKLKFLFFLGWVNFFAVFWQFYLSALMKLHLKLWNSSSTKSLVELQTQQAGVWKILKTKEPLCDWNIITSKHKQHERAKKNKYIHL